MAPHSIEHDLKQLRAELKAIDASEGATPEEVSRLLAQVNAALEKLDEEDRQRNLLEQLRASIEQYEAEHPQLMNQINRLIWSLTNAGL